MFDAVDSGYLVEAVGGAAALYGLHPRRLLACESAAKAYLVADISEKYLLEIETVAGELRPGNHSIS